MSANRVDPDQMPHHVASDLGLHCLPMTLYRFPGKNGLIKLLYLPYFLGYKTDFFPSKTIPKI